ncbi:MAG: hypothetical protein HQ541_05965 [Mariniphaga sp.]|nr:hypothetical protein [Mariniphaga sp.]
MFLCTGIIFCDAQNRISSENNLSIEIPEVALLSLKSISSSTINLSVGAADEAGLSLDFSNVNKNDIWVNYSSILPGNGIPSRNLKAKISGEIPDGIRLKIQASGDAGYGGGQTGIPIGEITLSNIQQTIISGIGSCYTGVGVQKGHQLTYSLELVDQAQYSSIQDDNYTLTVLFTMSDQN